MKVTGSVILAKIAALDKGLLNRINERVLINIDQPAKGFILKLEGCELSRFVNVYSVDMDLGSTGAVSGYSLTFDTLEEAEKLYDYLLSCFKDDEE